MNYEQTFLVATEKPKDEWLDQVYYQVKLQSTDLQAHLQSLNGSSYTHALSAFPIDLNNYNPDNGFFLPSSRNYVYIQTVYYYYRQLFQQGPEELYWAGMAKTAGASVYAGMVDINTWKTSVFVDDARVDKVLNDFMIQGNKDIFDDQSWTHHAYISSGIWALDYVEERQIKEGTRVSNPYTTYDGWADIDRGIKNSDLTSLRLGNQKLLLREQSIVMQPLYDVMKDVTLDPGSDLEQFIATDIVGISYPPKNEAGEINVDEMFSINGRNPVHYSLQPSLRDVVPNGRLSSFDDRWAWIDNSENGMLQIWLGTSTATIGLTETERTNINASVFWVHARLLSQLPTVGGFMDLQFPPKW